MPPNVSSTKASAELALQYLNDGKIDTAKIVIQNVIEHLADPHFGKPFYPKDEDVITTTTSS